MLVTLVDICCSVIIVASMPKEPYPWGRLSDDNSEGMYGPIAGGGQIPHPKMPSETRMSPHAIEKISFTPSRM